MERSLLSCKVSQLCTIFYFITLLLLFKTSGNFDTDLTYYTFPFSSSLTLINLNNFFSCSGILTLNCVHFSRPHSWFHFWYFSRQMLKLSVSATKGTVSFCVGTWVRELCRWKVVSYRFCRGIMSVPAAGGEEWRGEYEPVMWGLTVEYMQFWGELKKWRKEDENIFSCYLGK